jgi:hypothetical protein
MAIARCDKHTSDGTKHAYKAFALPLGYPETAAICGREGCEAPARLWLESLSTPIISVANEAEEKLAQGPISSILGQDWSQRSASDTSDRGAAPPLRLSTNSSTRQ